MLSIIKNACFLTALSLSQLVIAAGEPSELKQTVVQPVSSQPVSTQIPTQLVSKQIPTQQVATPQVTQDIGLNFNTGLDVIGGLFLVLALFMACAWLMKRTQGGFLAASKDMKTLGAMSLGTREKAVLVEVEGQKLLLGVSPGRVSTLHVFEADLTESDTVTVATDARDTTDKAETEKPSKNSKNDFASQLMQLIPKNNHSSTASK